MLVSLLAQAAEAPFDRPVVDWHALAPELVVVGVLCVVLVADLFLPEDRKALLPSLAGLGLLGALIPVLTLAVDGADRQLFGGAGLTNDLPLTACFALARALRIADGPDAVHRDLIAKLELRKHDPAAAGRSRS